ncbi:hypothetical protein [Sphingomonas sp.]|uniref:hypothetical protein n=1 Tax=Sphingomonas sp. TaxID=28214 RepID=UPI00307E2A54
MRDLDISLERYRAARAKLDEAVAAGATDAMIERLLDRAIDAAAAYIEMPAEVPQDLADKIEVIIADGDWSEHATVLLCDARRLAA